MSTLVLSRLETARPACWPLVIASLFYPCLALATKPCPPSPCTTPASTFDATTCLGMADWVAIGTISRVVHHEQGYPLLKDFAEFTLTVNKWEKGSGTPDQQIRFQVGWCENSQPLPKDTSGTFRFYGLSLPKDPSLPNQYLYFVPFQAPAK